MDLKVKNSGIIKLNFFRDPPDGDLFIAENRIQIPFDIKRVYFINKLNNPQAIRGKHAHKTLSQVIFAVSGSFLLELDDGVSKDAIILNDPSRGVLIGPGLWHTMTEFSPDCNIMVLADELYDEDDYIRDYDLFLKHGNAS